MKGSYILVVFVRGNIELFIGALGKIEFKKGFYLYIGSAMGNSGSITLINRVSRHTYPSESKKIHWHIDYLLNSNFISVYCVYLIPSLQNMECLIANELLNLSDGHIKKFGSSNCLCNSHLLYFKEFKSLKKLYQ
ncbi:MAG: GIY-YIG nuclease family protein [Candidatus Lokiarchaeota archaeon]|nr:GIY-YIG nuclease family protein [Candidatus Lokiarchaeota archaeon]